MYKILKQSTYDALISEIEALKSNNSKMLYVLLQNEELINKQNEEIETLKPKAEKYEKELKRQREKYNRLYKGKKKEPEYVIEGKSIKQLVEENLGLELEIDDNEYTKIGYVCGVNKDEDVIILGIKGNYGWCYLDSIFIMNNNYDTYWGYFHNDLFIEAIKKHRNIK